MNSLQGIPSQIKLVRERIEDCCRRCNRNPEEVTLVAVSKTKPLSLIEAALEVEQFHFGENRIQELVEKMDALSPALDAKVIWHMIGTLQSNKIKYMAHRVDWVQSVPKTKTLLELEKQVAKHKRTVNALIQINISDEDQKSGVSPEKVGSVLEVARSLKHVLVRGFMGIAENTDDAERVARQFATLRTVLNEHQSYNNATSIRLDTLSMGMSSDLEMAIEQGATMVRVGSDIFGTR